MFQVTGAYFNFYSIHGVLYGSSSFLYFQLQDSVSDWHFQRSPKSWTVNSRMFLGQSQPKGIFVEDCVIFIFFESAIKNLSKAAETSCLAFALLVLE